MLPHMRHGKKVRILLSKCEQLTDPSVKLSTVPEKTTTPSLSYWWGTHRRILRQLAGVQITDHWPQDHWRILIVYGHGQKDRWIMCEAVSGRALGKDTDNILDVQMLTRGKPDRMIHLLGMILYRLQTYVILPTSKKIHVWMKMMMTSFSCNLCYGVNSTMELICKNCNTTCTFDTIMK